MTVANSTVNKEAKLVVRRDMRAVRSLLRRIKVSVQFADLCLFAHRGPKQMMDYLDRRDCDRSRTEIPIYVTSVVFNGRHIEPLEDGQKEMFALTRDVSRRGVGFMHDEPFEGDYAIVTVDLLDGHPVSLVLEVRWSNVERGDTYMSGGRFFGIAESAEC